MPLHTCLHSKSCTGPQHCLRVACIHLRTLHWHAAQEGADFVSQTQAGEQARAPVCRHCFSPSDLACQSAFLAATQITAYPGKGQQAPGWHQGLLGKLSGGRQAMLVMQCFLACSCFWCAHTGLCMLSSRVAAQQQQLHARVQPSKASSRSLRYHQTSTYIQRLSIESVCMCAGMLWV